MSDPKDVLEYLRNRPVEGVDVDFLERSMRPGNNWFGRADVTQRDLVIAELVRRVEELEERELDAHFGDDV